MNTEVARDELWLFHWFQDELNYRLFALVKGINDISINTFADFAGVEGLAARATFPTLHHWCTDAGFVIPVVTFQALSHHQADLVSILITII